MIFLKSNSDNPWSGLTENYSERSGSFHDYSNDLRPAVRGMMESAGESLTLHYGKKDSKIGKILGNLYQITTVSKFMFLGMFRLKSLNLATK